MISEILLTEPLVAAEIHALAQAAYALEAQRIACLKFPPLRESLAQLDQSSDRFLIYQQSGTIIGALSFNRDGESVVITRLIVSPAHLRQGVASLLLAELERRLPNSTGFAVSTAEMNVPAVHLYSRFGYMRSGVSISAEGIKLLHLSKNKE